MDYEMIEYYHSMGYLPDKYYYQLNNKNADSNYRDQKNKRFKLSSKKNFLEDFVMNMLRATLDTTLKELMDIIIPTN